MWIIELNVAGYQFTRELPDLKRPPSGSARVICTGRYRGIRTLHDSATGGTTVPTTQRCRAGSHPTKRGGTRTKMLVSAAEVMRERGAAGVTIDAVLARSGAPRGSVYYHFPEGRNQILTEALRYSGDSITATIDAAADQGARALLREFIELWERLLTDGDFHAGCPVVAAAISSDETDHELTTEAGVDPGPLVHGIDPGVRQRRLRRRRRRLAGGDVDLRAGRRDRAVPLDPQRPPAQPGRRAARIPDQGKGIRYAATESPASDGRVSNGAGSSAEKSQSLAGSGLTSLSCSAVAPMLRLPAPGLVTSTSAPVSST